MNRVLENSAIDSFTAGAGLIGGPQAADTLVEVEFVCTQLELRADARVLDLPCGNGRHARALAERGMSVVAADIDAHSLAIARRSAAHPRVHYVELDAREATSLGSDFDAAISLFSCVGYFAREAEDRAALQALCSVLRPGGRILLSTANGPVVARADPRPVQFDAGALRIERTDRHDSAHRRLERQFRILDTRTNELVEIRHHRRLYASDELIAWLREFGIGNIRCAADYQGARFEPERSAHAIYMGERQR